MFGIELVKRERPIDLGRPFMARFGDIARIELVGEDVRVTLKSGTAFDLDYYAFNDFDDGVRVWDGLQGVLDLAPAMPRALPGTGDDRIRAVDLLLAPEVSPAHAASACRAIASRADAGPVALGPRA